MESLKELCTAITKEEKNRLPQGHPLGLRLVSPAGEEVQAETKTYPLLDAEQVFMICWTIMPKGQVYASMYPAPESFMYEFSYGAEMKTQPHNHDYIELGFVVSGSFHQIINDREIVFHEGEFCLIDKNSIHQDLLCRESAVILFLGISESIFLEITEKSPKADEISAFLQDALIRRKDLQQYLLFKPQYGEAKDHAARTLLWIARELIDRQPGTHHIRKGLLIRLFDILSVQYSFTLSRDQQKTIQALVYDKVVTYIKAHLRDVTITDLCSQFHYQEDYFNRLMKKNTGMTYSAYVQKKRIEYACQLLVRHPDQSIEEIAEETGYSNKGFFYKIFKKQVGMTPAEYRKA